MKNEILIKDLTERVVDGKVSADGDNKKGYWNVLDYEFERIGSGRAVAWNAPDSDLEDPDSGRAIPGSAWKPGPLTIRLGATGRYKISFITRYSYVQAKLTGKGHALMAEVFPGHGAYVEDLCGALDPEEQESLRGLLKKLGRAI